jgi:uncharacterized protein
MNATTAHGQAEMHGTGPTSERQRSGQPVSVFARMAGERQRITTFESGDLNLTTVQPSSRTGTIRNVSLKGPAGRLEAVLNTGSVDAPFAALVCHPHPVFGGSLHNKVVYHAMKALNDPGWGLGWPVLRFNFRGAGLSQGVHDGMAEVDDVLAALDWLGKEFGRPLIVAGFSFGAAMALRACCCPGKTRHDIRAVAALGLPVAIEGPAYHYSFLEKLLLPKLFVSGDRDLFSPPAELARVFAAASEPKRLVSLPDADHFFTGQLEPMQHVIADWMKEQSL